MCRRAPPRWVWVGSGTTPAGPRVRNGRGRVVCDLGGPGAPRQKFSISPRGAGQTITSSAGRIAVALNGVANGTGANPVGSPPGSVLKNRAFTAE